ncbi:hypothetical protein Y032_0011g1574 [Ancylostoma ceylanicum]|uniref:Uncharacterized protein n=1 Tax=Ancylostoma ceylanicum TaxID=53326 RepID=A0A016VHA3_9BILA|nr:hypothetical protein Y032_0011g1574 [Ancylostoma ceylanicum]
MMAKKNKREHSTTSLCGGFPHCTERITGQADSTLPAKPTKDTGQAAFILPGRPRRVLRPSRCLMMGNPGRMPEIYQDYHGLGEVTTVQSLCNHSPTTQMKHAFSCTILVALFMVYF